MHNGPSFSRAIYIKELRKLLSAAAVPGAAGLGLG
jgi:hypothetical protein